MTGAGTDKTKTGFDLNGPAMILVEPQLGVNIGMAARAMGNFALCELRIVNPRDGWPNIAAQRAAAGADHVLDGDGRARGRRAPFAWRQGGHPVWPGALGPDQ